MARQERSRRVEGAVAGDERAVNALALSDRMLRAATLDVSRTDFLREALRALIEFAGCDAVELELTQGDTSSTYTATQSPEGTFRFHAGPSPRDPEPKEASSRPGGRGRTPVSGNSGRAGADASGRRLTKNGSFWTGDTECRLARPEGTGRRAPVNGADHEDPYRSLAVIPLAVADESVGSLKLMSRRRSAFTEADVRGFEDIAQTLGIAAASQRAQLALRERVKELACLYGIAQVAGQPGAPLEHILQSIVELLPPAWQYPEITSARLTFDGRRYSTSGFREGGPTQAADIVIQGDKRGLVEVSYAEARGDLDGGPFLKEERSLIDAVARNVALVIERRNAAEEQARLQEQLMHADRLATVGQLAAGVAHELNEPLSNILGFAQLVQKEPGVPPQAGHDMDRIVGLALHAREIIRMLLVFARQVPSNRAWVSLNQVVEDGLYFFKARCAKTGIDVVCSLVPDLPDAFADPTQLKQVVVNLVVNALQAMPNGGELKVETWQDEDNVMLAVEDTGIGMDKKTMEQVFVPFFTTKDVGEGTGLGLPVAHGIVTSHGGSINVQSKMGRGARFEIRLPVNDVAKEEKKGPDGSRD